MTSYISVECFVCGEFANLHRCGMLFSPSTKRRPTKKHSLCNFCYYKLRRLAELLRGEAMKNIAIVFSDKDSGISASNFHDVIEKSRDRSKENEIKRCTTCNAETSDIVRHMLDNHIQPDLSETITRR